MQHQKRAGEGGLEDVVPVRNRENGVGVGVSEAEQRGGAQGIDGMRGPGEGAGPPRASTCPRVHLDESLPVKWLPQDGEAARENDPRTTITLRDVLHMSSGLYPVDNDRCNTVGSCLSYFAGASSIEVSS